MYIVSPGLEAGQTLRSSSSDPHPLPTSTAPKDEPDSAPLPTLPALPTLTEDLPPGHERCSYCGSAMPALRLLMHQRHCALSTFKCPLCKLVHFLMIFSAISTLLYRKSLKLIPVNDSVHISGYIVVLQRYPSLHGLLASLYRNCEKFLFIYEPAKSSRFIYIRNDRFSLRHHPVSACLRLPSRSTT